MCAALPPPLDEHYEDPFHQGELADATHEGEAIHDGCPDGRDVLVLQLHIADDGAIAEAWFDGEGCPWCLAVASHFTERISESTLDEVAAITTVTTADVPESSIPEPRGACANLVLRALQAALASAADDEDGPHFSGPHLGEEQ